MNEELTIKRWTAKRKSEACSGEVKSALNIHLCRPHESKVYTRNVFGKDLA
jgi:hypothetical protein